MFQNKKIISIIPAKKDNNNIDQLNLKDLGGKPLISYTIKAAQKSKFIDEIYLSTEDSKIASLAENYGIEVPSLRPDKLNKKNTSSLDVASFVLRAINKSFDFVLILLPNAPFRDSNIIDQAIEFMIENSYEKVRGVKLIEDYFLYKDSYESVDERNFENGYGLPRLHEQTIVGGGMYLYSSDRLLSSEDNLPWTNFIIPEHNAILIKSLYDLLVTERLVNLNQSLIDSLIKST